MAYGSASCSVPQPCRNSPNDPTYTSCTAMLSWKYKVYIRDCRNELGPNMRDSLVALRLPLKSRCRIHRGSRSHTGSWCVREIKIGAPISRHGCSCHPIRDDRDLSARLTNAHSSYCVRQIRGITIVSTEDFGTRLEQDRCGRWILTATMFSRKMDDLRVDIILNEVRNRFQRESKALYRSYKPISIPRI